MTKFVSKENLQRVWTNKLKTPVNFAQEEYNKTINLLNINNYVDFGTALGFDISGLEIGKTYTFSSNKAMQYLKISTSSSGYTSVGKEDRTSGFTKFTFVMARNSNISETATQYLFIEALDRTNWFDDISQLEGYEIQIEEGSEATEYQKYNGEIVHYGQIKDFKEKVCLYDMDGVLGSHLTYTDGIKSAGLTVTIPNKEKYNYCIAELSFADKARATTMFNNQEEINSGAISFWNTTVSDMYCACVYSTPTTVTLKASGYYTFASHTWTDRNSSINESKEYRITKLWGCN